MADYTATIEVIVEVELTAANEDAAWEKAEAKNLPDFQARIEEAIGNHGGTVFSATVSEVEEH
jgi:hypothetical protein